MAEPDLCSAGKPEVSLTVDAAQLRAVAAVAPMLETEQLLLEAALGRVVAGSPLAVTDLPPFDNSAMDGYAIRCADLGGEGPFRLRVADRIIAGDTRRVRLAYGTTARIFTGAVIPEGADAVIMQERVNRWATQSRSLKPRLPD